MPRRTVEVSSTPEHLALWHGAFGKVAPNLRSYKIIGFDTEDTSEGLPLAFGFHDGQKSYYTRSWDDAITYIYNYPQTAIFCAHNLEYDIGNLFKACNYKYIREMIYASKLLKVTLFGTSHSFLNSSSFFAGSLGKMGDVVGIKKLDGDPFNPDYCINDAKIVQVFMDKLQTRHHAQGVNLGLSVGQMAMGIYRANFVKTKIRTYNSPNCLKAYYGGRVEMFYKGVVEGPVYVTDINSSYPDVMRRYEYPDTAYMQDSSIFTHQFGIGHFIVDVPATLFVPVLPFRSETGRLFFPTGRVEGWWTYAEVRYAISLGCSVVSELSGEGTNRSVQPFTDFIDSVYDARQAAKRRKKLNPDDAEAAFDDLFFKLEMNNLYGKFAQHKASSKMTRVKLSGDELAKLEGYIEHKQGPFYAYRIPRKKPPRTANYLWGVYVTSYARISLHQKIMSVHSRGGKLLYCDTDSIMFTGEKAIEGLTIGDSLGEMSKEVFDLAVFRASKGYLLCKHRQTNLKSKAPEYSIEKVACKGVPTHLAHDFIVKGMTTALKPMRLKEAIIRTHAEKNKGRDADFFKDIGVNVWRDMPKKMQSIYIKRRGDKGVTYPIDVLDIPEAEDNAYGKPTSIEEDLIGFSILPQKKKGEEFRDTKNRVPKDWFTDAIEEEREHAFFDSQKIQFLKREECLDLKPGDSWFSGQIVDRRLGQFGRHYILFLKTYHGEKVAKKNILVACSERHFIKKFGSDFSYLKKKVEFFLEEIYTGKGPLKTRIELIG